MIKKILIFLIIVILALFQVSFLYHFSFLFNYFNLIFLLVFLTTIYSGWKVGIKISLIAGITLDLYSSFSFGLITVSLILSTLTTYFLYKKLFTRYNIYSMSISGIASLIAYFIVLWSGSLLMSLLIRDNFYLQLNQQFFINILIQLLLNQIIFVLTYLILKIFNKKIRFLRHSTALLNS